MQRRLAAGLCVLTVAAVAGPAAAWVLPAGSGSAPAAATSLTAPSGITATAAGSTAIDIAFVPASAQPSGTLTRVVRDRAVGGSTVVCTQAASPCRDTALTAGTTYGYTVQTVLFGWSKAAAAAVSATTTATLSVTTTSLPAATAGTSYSQTLSASGGTAPYGWSTSSGTLPAGLALSGDGVVSGTPSAAGAYSFTVRAKDGAGQTATAPLSITVSAASQVSTPAAPTLASGSDSGSSQSDRITNLAQPTLHGTAAGGATVTVFVDGSPVGTTSAPANGSYTYQLPTALADGPRTITVSQTVSGATSARSTALALTIDTVALALSPLAYVDQQNSTADAITGTAEANATVKAIGGATSYTATASATGSFAIAVAALEGKQNTPVAYSYSVSQTDVAGNASPAVSVAGNDTK